VTDCILLLPPSHVNWNCGIGSNVELKKIKNKNKNDNKKM